MIINVDLHLRSHPADEHRALGAVRVEFDGARLELFQDIVCESGEREIRAQITSIHARPGHMPHVYADELTAAVLAH